MRIGSLRIRKNDRPCIKFEANPRTNGELVKQGSPDATLNNPGASQAPNLTFPYGPDHQVATCGDRRHRSTVDVGALGLIIISMLPLKATACLACTDDIYLLNSE